MLRTSLAVVVASIALVLVWVPPAASMPAHDHGVFWTSYEWDRDLGVYEAHNHSTATTEAGDTFHQHFMQLLFNGFGTEGEPFSAFGVWDNETAYIDYGWPFGLGYNGLTGPTPHGFIEAGHEPDYFFYSGSAFARPPDYRPSDWSSEAAQHAQENIEIAFSQWSGFHADVSPATGQPLTTGIGFTEAASQADAEIIVLWEDLPDDCGGGGVIPPPSQGAHTSADPIVLRFDSSYDYCWAVDSFSCDDHLWHFHSIAIHEVGHLMFLEHQADLKDVMNPPVGEPLDYDCNGDDIIMRWEHTIDNAGELSDGFSGRWYSVNPSGPPTHHGATDYDSAVAVKSLYSIPSASVEVRQSSWGTIKAMYR